MGLLLPYPWCICIQLITVVSLKYRGAGGVPDELVTGITALSHVHLYTASDR